MKIDSSVKSLGGLAGGARKETAKPGASAPAQPAAGQGGGVELSSQASRLQQLASSLASSPVADSARVNAIRDAISAGTFKIDASKIADGLIDSVRQMLAAEK